MLENGNPSIPTHALKCEVSIFDMAEIVSKIKSFLVQCGRVWHILRKPDSHEYKITAKVAAIGLGIIGIMGFVISVIINYF